jgi:hypothetical protein
LLSSPEVFSFSFYYRSGVQCSIKKFFFREKLFWSVRKFTGKEDEKRKKNDGERKPSGDRETRKSVFVESGRSCGKSGKNWSGKSRSS